ncbi:class I mannose-6-phosphate isomerase [Sphingobium sp. CAP-1]|uniref:class I mannose-6-phosphate isomerase n=1 Tax=Sphingobium sp. CAP-1 TaxID=2676077 RepID=UPI0012BB2075|nr:class I mannose-6-phosphate isomerase [Sphingobium sp. CAP-1]QGP81007.1 phosphoheptose isomerase [Sphingobium sp. CAP-1]
MKLVANYVEKPWGRHDLPNWASPPQDLKEPIGELWFTPPDGAHLPLLVKYLFTSERLSVQVHPDDAQGHARGLAGGKTECWYIVDAQPGATLGIGLKRVLDPQQLRDAALDGSIEREMVWHPVTAGDFFFIPAGTVHAVGAGITLVEVQQNVDVTYRLYDYGRPRELHLEDGAAVSRALPYDMSNAVRASEQGPVERTLAQCPIFTVLRATDADDIRAKLGNRPVWIIPLNGMATAAGETAIVGACLYLDSPASLRLSEDALVLVAVEGQD